MTSYTLSNIVDLFCRGSKDYWLRYSFPCSVYQNVTASYRATGTSTNNRSSSEFAQLNGIGAR